MGTVIDTIALPFEVGHVFDAIGGIYGALPLAMRLTILGCFGVLSVFIILKMLA